MFAPTLRLSRLLRPVAFLLFVSVSALALSGCKKSKAAIVVKEEPAVVVQTEVATLLQTPKRLRLTGTLRGAKETELAANVAGRIIKTDVERGQVIKKGALLAKVDIQAARLALSAAKVNVQTSEAQAKINVAECERYDRLKAAGVVTDLEYDKVTAKCKTTPLNLEAARAQQSIAAKNVGDGMIRAPFSGVVTERYVEVGEYVQPASPVVSLAQVDDLRIVFAVPERNYPDVKIGAKVRLQVAAYDGQVFEGEVALISGAVRVTRDIVVEATISNADRKLVPGMFANVELAIGTEPLPSVPVSAVFQQNGKNNILVAAGGKLEQRVVATLLPQDGRIPIRRGLKEGEEVAFQNVAELKNGQRIQSSPQEPVNDQASSTLSSPNREEEK